MQPDIKVVADYVQERVGEDEFDRDVRVSSRELGDQRCEATSAYLQRCADAQMSLRRRASRTHLGFDLIEIREDGSGALVKQAAFLRQAEMSAATINQSRAQPALHGGKPSAHGRRRAVQTSCRL